MDHDVSQVFSQSRYNTNPQPDTSDAKATILQNLPSYSAFYIETHGNIGIFGDSYYYVNEPYTPSQLLFAWTDPTSSPSIPTELTTKAITVPPYNFVFIDGCDTGDDASLAIAFGVNTISDTGFLGWNTETMDESARENCDQLLMEDLAIGTTLKAAKNDALSTYPVDSVTTGDKAANLMIYGDESMTLHGIVYGSNGTTGTWYK